MPKRVILAVPENNTTLHEEMVAYCPEFREVALARVPRPHRSMAIEDYPQYRRSALDVVTPLLSESAELVIFGCTGAGFVGGPEGNREIVEALRQRTGLPVVSTVDAMIGAMRRAQATVIDVLSPYVDWKNQRLVAYFAAYGIEVAGLDSFAATNTSELAMIGSDQVLDRALGVASIRGDALFIACTQLPTRHIIGDLRARLARPVWSAARATAWHALKTLDIDATRLE